MGCWNPTCAISGLTCWDPDAVYGLILLQQTSPPEIFMGSCYYDDLFEPINHPLWGTFDSYGSVNLAEPPPEYLLKYLREHGVDFEDIADLQRKILTGDEVTSNHGSVRYSFTLVRKDVWEAMEDLGRNEDREAELKRIDAILDVKTAFGQNAPKVLRYVANFAQPRLVPDALAEHIMSTGDIGSYREELRSSLAVMSAMSNLNIMWLPTMAGGSQKDNAADKAKFFERMVTIALASDREM
jgi:hypothetical protein